MEGPAFFLRFRQAPPPKEAIVAVLAAAGGVRMCNIEAPPSDATMAVFKISGTARAKAATEAVMGIFQDPAHPLTKQLRVAAVGLKQPTQFIPVRTAPKEKSTDVYMFRGPSPVVPSLPSPSPSPAPVEPEPKDTTKQEKVFTTGTLHSSRNPTPPPEQRVSTQGNSTFAPTTRQSRSPVAADWERSRSPAFVDQTRLAVKQLEDQEAKVGGSASFSPSTGATNTKVPPLPLHQQQTQFVKTKSPTAEGRSPVRSTSPTVEQSLSNQAQLPQQTSARDSNRSDRHITKTSFVQRKHIVPEAPAVASFSPSANRTPPSNTQQQQQQATPAATFSASRPTNMSNMHNTNNNNTNRDYLTGYNNKTTSPIRTSSPTIGYSTTATTTTPPTGDPMTPPSATAGGGSSAPNRSPTYQSGVGSVPASPSQQRQYKLQQQHQQRRSPSPTVFSSEVTRLLQNSPSTEELIAKYTKSRSDVMSVPPPKNPTTPLQRDRDRDRTPLSSPPSPAPSPAVVTTSGTSTTCSNVGRATPVDTTAEGPTNSIQTSPTISYKEQTVGGGGGPRPSTPQHQPITNSRSGGTPGGGDFRASPTPTSAASYNRSPPTYSHDHQECNHNSPYNRPPRSPTPSSAHNSDNHHRSPPEYRYTTRPQRSEGVRSPSPIGAGRERDRERESNSRYSTAVMDPQREHTDTPQPQSQHQQQAVQAPPSFTPPECQGLNLEEYQEDQPLNRSPKTYNSEKYVSIDSVDSLSPSSSKGSITNNNSNTLPTSYNEDPVIGSSSNGAQPWPVGQPQRAAPHTRSSGTADCGPRVSSPPLVGDQRHYELPPTARTSSTFVSVSPQSSPSESPRSPSPTVQQSTIRSSSPTDREARARSPRATPNPSHGCSLVTQETPSLFFPPPPDSGSSGPPGPASSSSASASAAALPPTSHPHQQQDRTPQVTAVKDTQERKVGSSPSSVDPGTRTGYNNSRPGGISGREREQQDRLTATIPNLEYPVDQQPSPYSERDQDTYTHNHHSHFNPNNGGTNHHHSTSGSAAAPTHTTKHNTGASVYNNSTNNNNNTTTNGHAAIRKQGPAASGQASYSGGPPSQASPQKQALCFAPGRAHSAHRRQLSTTPQPHQQQQQPSTDTSPLTNIPSARSEDSTCTTTTTITTSHVQRRKAGVSPRHDVYGSNPSPIPPTPTPDSPRSDDVFFSQHEVLPGITALSPPRRSLRAPQSPTSFTSEYSTSGHSNTSAPPPSYKDSFSPPTQQRHTTNFEGGNNNQQHTTKTGNGTMVHSSRSNSPVGNNTFISLAHSFPEQHTNTNAWQQHSGGNTGVQTSTPSRRQEPGKPSSGSQPLMVRRTPSPSGIRPPNSQVPLSSNTPPKQVLTPPPPTYNEAVA